MRSDKLRRITFLLGFLGLVFLAALPLIVLRSIQKQSYRTQSIVKAPESVFRYWRWPGQSWQLYHEDLTLISQPSRVFTGVDGKITPQLWNLLMGCSSGTNIALNSLDVTVPSLKDGVQTLRSLLLDLSREAHLFHKYVCHSTGFSVNKGRLRLSAGETQYDLKINKLGYQKAEAPGVEIDGVLKSGELFGLTLTYKPEDDILVFTSDLGHQARFDGQIESFSSAEKSFLSGELHSPAVLWSPKNKKRDVFSAEGTFTISANLSGELADLTAQLWSAETLRIDGAVDARTGTLKPFNLPADVLREAGQIPALTQLNQLIQERALPKSFYVDETPFELLRFLVHKEGRLITLSRFVLKHSSYLAAGEGSINPETKRILFTGSLVLSDDLSQSLIQNVPKLGILVGEGGRLAFPFKLEGNLKSLKAHADVKLMTEKLISAYRSELVRRGNSRIETIQS